MKKVQLSIIILVVIVLFAAGDYFVNAPGSLTVSVTDAPEQDSGIQLEDPYPNLVQELLDFKSDEYDYRIAKRERSMQIFEKFDMSTLNNAVIYLNTLLHNETGTPIVIYEIQAEKNQGALTFQNIKLKVINQIKQKGSVNEVTNYGYNAFFYNDPDNENTGFLLSQIKDNLFGFQYNKSDENNFTTIKSMINALMEIDLLI